MRQIYLIICLLIGSSVLAQSVSINDIEKKADRSEFTIVIDKILGVQQSVSGKASLQSTIKGLDAEYENLNYPGSKLAVALVTPLLKVKSLFYKLIPLFRRGNMSHSIVVTAARQLAGIGSLYSGYQHWEAARHFIYEPFSGTTKQFTNEAELKNYIIKTLAPELKKMINRLKSIDGIVGSKGSFLWDNKLLLDSTSFSDGVGRYKKVGSTEVRVLISNVYLALSNIFAFDAYQITGLIDTIDEIGLKIGFDKATSLNRVNVPVNGISHKTLADVIGDKDRSGFLTLSNKHSMKMSYHYLRAASDYALYAWNDLKDRTNEDSFIINANIFTPVQSIVDANINKYREILGCTGNECANSFSEKVVTIKSLVSDKSVDVNMYKFFITEPPQDLRKFLPTKFELSGGDILSKNIDGKVYKYRNYERGMATGWDTSIYKRYAPSVSTNEDIKDVAKLLSEVFLGNIMGMVFFQQ